tara:strand:+ start:2811 stop:3203 length:393 start_codon:yes stop_codon:yes gene_type:complete
MKLPKITPEQTIEIANKMIQHVLKHGKCVDEGGYCVYRDSSGNSCAIGSQIKDEHYTPTIEGKNLDENEGARKPLEVSIGASLNKRAADLFHNIQSAHDDAHHADFNQSFIDSLPNDDGLIIELIGESNE